MSLPPSGSDGPPTLELRDIVKSYGATRALRGVTTRVVAGEKVALVGENGAGKSTLAAIACGLVKPDSGEIVVSGTVLQRYGPIEAQAAGIRIAPQHVMLCPNLSVAENIGLGHVPTTVRGVIDRRSLYETAEARLADLGISGLDVKRQAEHLSTVEKAFVQIARVLTDGAKVLLVDEPTAPMDGTEVSGLLDLLERVAARGVGILYVSHRLHEVLRLADRAVVLRDGRIVAELPRTEITEERLVRAMVGTQSTVAPPDAPATSRVRGDARPPAMVVRDLSYRNIVRASFEVGWGEIVAIYGTGGSGRDEIGSVLAGAREPDGGDIVVDGLDIRTAKISDLIERGIGYVPPDRAQVMLPEFSIRDNISLPLQRRLASRGIKQRGAERHLATKWATRLSIKMSSVEAPLSSLSGGSQQKVLLARWLAAGARVFILEDPTRGVDVATKQEIYRLLRSLAEEGMAAVVASSDIEDTLALADRVLVMARGEIVASLVRPTQDEILSVAIGHGS